MEDRGSTGKGITAAGKDRGSFLICKISFIKNYYIRVFTNRKMRSIIQLVSGG